MSRLILADGIYTRTDLVITTSSAATGYPASNIGLLNRDEHWRSTELEGDKIRTITFTPTVGAGNKNMTGVMLTGLVNRSMPTGGTLGGGIDLCTAVHDGRSYELKYNAGRQQAYGKFGDTLIISNAKPLVINTTVQSNGDILQCGGVVILYDGSKVTAGDTYYADVPAIMPDIQFQKAQKKLPFEADGGTVYIRDIIRNHRIISFGLDGSEYSDAADILAFCSINGFNQEVLFIPVSDGDDLDTRNVQGAMYNVHGIMFNDLDYDLHGYSERIMSSITIREV